MARVAINGFGRIGRCFLRSLYSRSILSTPLEIVAVNDLTPPENLAYLLKHDTVYKDAPFTVAEKDGTLVVGGKEIKVLQVKEPALSPWKDLNIDIVIESTGLFTDPVKARGHIDAGAKRVVITAPAKGPV